MENNAFARSVAAFHVPKAMGICSSKETTSRTQLHLGCCRVSVIYCRALGSPWFSRGQTDEWNGDRFTNPESFRVFCHSPRKWYCFRWTILNWIWKECPFRNFHLGFPTDQGINGGCTCIQLYIQGLWRGPLDVSMDSVGPLWARPGPGYLHLLPGAHTSSL